MKVEINQTIDNYTINVSENEIQDIVIVEESSTDEYIIEIAEMGIQGPIGPPGPQGPPGTSGGSMTAEEIRTTLGATSSTNDGYLLSSDWSEFKDHLTEFDNPHNVTKAQIGLSNVPDIDATNPNNIIQDSAHRFATDTEKTTWNGKQNAIGYTPANDNNVIHKSGNETKSGSLTVDSIIKNGGTDQQLLLANGSVTDFASVVSGGQTEVFNWKYLTNITNTDPGNGNFKANSVTASLINKLYIGDITSVMGVDMSAMFAKISGNWLIHIQQTNDASKYIQFYLNGNLTDNSGWWTLPVTFIQGSGFPLPNAMQCSFVFVNQNNINDLTIDAIPIDGSTNPIQSNGVFDALVLKENSSNKTDTIAGNESSSTLYANILGLTNYLKNGILGLLPSKTSLIDSDNFIIGDNADSNKTKKITWLNLKAAAKTYFDTLYSSKSISPGKQPLTSTIIWTGTTAPSGTATNTYNWQRGDGNVVTANFSLMYSVAGTGLTAVTIALPSDMPAPIKPDGYTAALNRLYIGVGYLSNNISGTSAATSLCSIRNNSSNTGFDIILVQSSAGYNSAQLQIQYFTA